MTTPSTSLRRRAVVWLTALVAGAALLPLAAGAQGTYLPLAVIWPRGVLSGRFWPEAIVARVVWYESEPVTQLSTGC